MDRYIKAWDTPPDGKVHRPEDFDRLENGGIRKIVFPVVLSILSLLRGCPSLAEERTADVCVPDIIKYRLDSLDIDNLNRPRPFQNYAIV